MLVSPAFESQRQEDGKFEATLGLHSETLFQINKRKTESIAVNLIKCVKSLFTPQTPLKNCVSGKKQKPMLKKKNERIRKLRQIHLRVREVDRGVHLRYVSKKIVINVKAFCKECHQLGTRKPPPPPPPPAGPQRILKSWQLEAPVLLKLG
jgi:hypothetical protein